MNKQIVFTSFGDISLLLLRLSFGTHFSNGLYGLRIEKSPLQIKGIDYYCPALPFAFYKDEDEDEDEMRGSRNPNYPWAIR